MLSLGLFRKMRPAARLMKREICCFELVIARYARADGRRSNKIMKNNIL